jgi:hypothetical protein
VGAVLPFSPANEPPPDATLAALVRVVEGLAAKVEALSAEVAALRSASPVPVRSLSLRQAAKALGKSRTRTLPRLISEGHIRVVTIDGKPTIPSDEIERVIREGTAPAPPKAKRPAPTRNRAPLARDLA